MISSQKKFQPNRSFLRPPQFPLKFGSDPFKGEKKIFRLWGSWYSNRPAWTHEFNAKIGFEKCAPSPEISAKMCPKSAFYTKPAKFDTFWPISRDSMHIFQNRFQRWNRVYELVDLNTMNPIIRTIFFTYKGVRAILSAISSFENGPKLTFWVHILV